MGWIDEYFFLCIMPNKNSCAIYVFKPGALSLSSALGKVEIPAAPVFFDCIGSRCVLIDSSNTLYEFQFVPQIENGSTRSAELLEVSRTVLRKFTPTERMLLIKEHDDFSAVCLDKKGDLYLQHLKRSTKTTIGTNVDDFWLADGTVLMFGQTGSKIWQRLEGMEPETLQDAISDAYPVGICLREGLIVGIVQQFHSVPIPRISEMAVPSIPFMKMRTLSFFFLHKLINAAMEKGDTERAEALLKLPVDPQALVLALELVLKDSYNYYLENKDERLETFKPYLVFLRLCEDYPTVVMRCARKMEPSLWERLFELAGDPVELFNKCIAQRKYYSAASYLKIILYMKDEQECLRCVCILLVHTLAQRDYNVCRHTNDNQQKFHSSTLQLSFDLVRFSNFGAPLGTQMEATHPLVKTLLDRHIADLDYAEKLHFQKYFGVVSKTE